MTEEAHVDLRTARVGVYDFLSKPINTSHLRVLLSNLVTRLSVAEENQRMRRKLIEAGTLGPIIGQSFVMRRFESTLAVLTDESSAPSVTRQSQSSFQK